jgi:hypothetical protein
MASRPPSRIYLMPLESSFSNIYSHDIQSHLSAINPRALATHPPQEANIDLIKHLHLILHTLDTMHTSANYTDNHIHNLVLIQQKIITSLHNHFIFLRKQKWIPR